MNIIVFRILSSVGSLSVMASCRTKKRLMNFFIVCGLMLPIINLISSLLTEVRKNLQFSVKPVIFFVMFSVA